MSSRQVYTKFPSPLAGEGLGERGRFSLLAGWCCFPSKLGRIVQEQGRAQLGKSWGSAKHPDCSGFTIEELGLLKFDEMDLSEFLSDINPTEKIDYFLENAIERAGETSKGNNPDK